MIEEIGRLTAPHQPVGPEPPAWGETTYRDPGQTFLACRFSIVQKEVCRRPEHILNHTTKETIDTNFQEVWEGAVGHDSLIPYRAYYRPSPNDEEISDLHFHGGLPGYFIVLDSPWGSNRAVVNGDRFRLLAFVAGSDDLEVWSPENPHGEPVVIYDNEQDAPAGITMSCNAVAAEKILQALN